MTLIENYIGFQTLIRREWQRTIKVINQVIWPPIITTLLYVFVFGLALGSRIKSVGGVPYAEYLIPGLIMLQVIDASYGESSSSLFQGRFLGSIQELLIAPLSAAEILGGFLVAGIMRSFVIAALIFVVGILTVHVVPHNIWLAIFVIAMVSILFSAMGIIFGLMAEKFDHIAVFTTFIITPLTFVGGVFTSISFLPPFMRVISLCNPIFYLIDALRFAFSGTADIGIVPALAVGLVLTVAATFASYRLVASGYKLRA